MADDKAKLDDTTKTDIDDWSYLREQAEKKYLTVRADPKAFVACIRACHDLIGKLSWYQSFIDARGMMSVAEFSDEWGGQELARRFRAKGGEVKDRMDDLKKIMLDMGDTFLGAGHKYRDADRNASDAFNNLGDLTKVDPIPPKATSPTDFTPGDTGEHPAAPPVPPGTDGGSSIIPAVVDGWSFWRWNDFGKSLVGKDWGANGAGIQYVWLAQQLRQDLKDLNGTLAQVVKKEMWTGEGADKAVEAVERFINNSLTLSMGIENLGNNLIYCSKWINAMYHDTPRRTIASDCDKDGWMKGYRETYRTVYKPGIEGAVAAMPAIFATGVEKKPPANNGGNNGNNSGNGNNPPDGNQLAARRLTAEGFNHSAGNDNGNENGNGNSNGNQNGNSDGDIDRDSKNFKAGLQEGYDKRRREDEAKNGDGGNQGGGNQGGGNQGGGNQGGGNQGGGNPNGGSQGNGNSGGNGNGSDHGGSNDRGDGGQVHGGIDKNSPDYQAGYQEGYKKGLADATGSNGSNGSGSGGDNSGGSTGNQTGSNPYTDNNSPNSKQKYSVPPKTQPGQLDPKELLKQLSEGKNPFQNLSPEQLQKIGADLLGGLSPDLLKQMSPEALQKLGSDFLQHLSPEDLRKFGSDMVNGLGPDFAKGLAPETLRDLSPETWQKLGDTLTQTPGGVELMKALTDGLKSMTGAFGDIVKIGTEAFTGLAKAGIPGFGDPQQISDFAGSAIPSDVPAAFGGGHSGGPGGGVGGSGGVHSQLTSGYQAAKLFPRATAPTSLDGSQLATGPGSSEPAGATSPMGGAGGGMGGGQGAGAKEYKRGKFLDSVTNFDDAVAPDVVHVRPVIEP